MKISPRNKIVSDIISIGNEKLRTQREDQSLFSLLVEMESRLRKMPRTNPVAPIGLRSISEVAHQRRSGARNAFRYVE